MTTRLDFAKIYALGRRHGAQYHVDTAVQDAEMQALFATVSEPLPAPSKPTYWNYCRPDDHHLGIINPRQCLRCTMSLSRLDYPNLKDYPSLRFD